MKAFYYDRNDAGLTREELRKGLIRSLEGRTLKKVLLIPPDFTRLHSNAGLITNIYYHTLRERGCEVDILPALGTHLPVTQEEAAVMFGDIPYEKFLVHNWRTDVTQLGQIPSEFLQAATEGMWNEPISVEVNRKVMDPSYDLIISIGQVVPHEVVGMANHSKNLLVGVGGSELINKSHLIGAVYGLERMMGKDHTPVRKLFDYAMERFLAERPILFVLTVCTAPQGIIRTHGLFIGEGREPLEAAIELSQKKNIIFLPHGIRKCVVYLDPREFKSTWLGNKAVYRTRMAIADGGELIILAPGVRQFGEDKKVDSLIRKYGYRGRIEILEALRRNKDLQENMGAAAHLIHGSSDGRFQITYAVREISQEEICEVGYQSANYDLMARRYPPEKLQPGFQITPEGDEIFYVPNPALGLWINKEVF